MFFDTINGAIKPSGSDNNPLNGNRTNFAPRLSLAWSPRPDNTGFFGGGHTALRLGFGIYYGVGQVEDQIQPIESDRIASTVNNSAFDPNLAGFAQTVRQNFIGNPNKSIKPRAAVTS